MNHYLWAIHQTLETMIGHLTASQNLFVRVVYVPVADRDGINYELNHSITIPFDYVQSSFLVGYYNDIIQFISAKHKAKLKLNWPMH